MLSPRWASSSGSRVALWGFFWRYSPCSPNLKLLRDCTPFSVLVRVIFILALATSEVVILLNLFLSMMAR